MPHKRPNILFVQTDQQRPEWVEMNPDIPVRTPHLRQLAERGVWLANAICPSPVCAPSRACLVAGQEYDRTRVWGNSIYAPDKVMISIEFPQVFQRLSAALDEHLTHG